MPKEHLYMTLKAFAYDLKKQFKSCLLNWQFFPLVENGFLAAYKPVFSNLNLIQSSVT
jgi:hypothetical protein